MNDDNNIKFQHDRKMREMWESLTQCDCQQYVRKDEIEVCPICGRKKCIYCENDHSIEKYRAGGSACLCFKENLIVIRKNIQGTYIHNKNNGHVEMIRSNI